MGINSLRYPALFKRISRRPNSFSVWRAAWDTSSHFVTSSLNVKIWGADLPADFAAERTSCLAVSRSERALRAMPFAPALA